MRLARNGFYMASRLPPAPALAPVRGMPVRTAHAGVFGPEPTAVSSAHGANGPSGSPAISGDDRTVRFVAFHSFASNLVAGDTNGALDVFVYRRTTRRITRVSVASGG